MAEVKDVCAVRRDGGTRIPYQFRGLRGFLILDLSVLVGSSLAGVPGFDVERVFGDTGELVVGPGAFERLEGGLAEDVEEPPGGVSSKGLPLRLSFAGGVYCSIVQTIFSDLNSFSGCVPSFTSLPGSPYTPPLP